ncbi:hypothetical protein BGW41_003368 [Actinomortierella wolfii]|nr:hypothetical protein BGW41_003368 [Actinomortierella wolfii]
MSLSPHSGLANSCGVKETSRGTRSIGTERTTRRVYTSQCFDSCSSSSSDDEGDNQVISIRSRRMLRGKRSSGALQVVRGSDPTVKQSSVGDGTPSTRALAASPRSTSSTNILSTFVGIFASSCIWKCVHCPHHDLSQEQQQQQQQQQQQKREQKPHQRQRLHDSCTLRSRRDSILHVRHRRQIYSSSRCSRNDAKRDHPFLITTTTSTTTTVKNNSTRHHHEPQRTFIDCRRAAEEGEIEAMFELGWMYEHGFRVPQDLLRAVHWYLVAAQAGHALAQYHLGMLCEKEEEIKDSEQGKSEGKDNKFKPCHQEKTIEEPQNQDLTRNEMNPVLGKGQQGHQLSQQLQTTTAREWYAKAAKQGVANAQFKIGTYYDTQTLLSKDREKRAMTCTLPAMERELGEGEKRLDLDDLKAVKWYRRAAMQGHSEAQYRLGCMYEDGRGVYRENAEAYRWLLRAAEQGHRQAQTHIGWMLKQGKGIDGNGQDDVQALTWLRRAANQGDIDAWFRLGEMYEQGGRGVGRDDCKAVACYIRAMTRGHHSAEERYLAMRQKRRGVHQLPVIGPDWVRVVPNYLFGCLIHCQKIFKRMIDSETEDLESSSNSEPALL